MGFCCLWVWYCLIDNLLVIFIIFSKFESVYNYEEKLCVCVGRSLIGFIVLDWSYR